MAEGTVDRSCQSAPGCGGREAVVERNRPGVDSQEVSRGADLGSERWLREQAGELGGKGTGEVVATSRVETIEDEVVDGDVELHRSNARSSASDNGLCSLAYSRLAARSRCAMPTGLCSSAAEKAAASAMFRM